MRDVEFRMERLAAHASSGPQELGGVLASLPALYQAWIAAQERGIAAIAGIHRQATARRLIYAAREACGRIADGIALLRTDAQCGGRARR